MKLAGAEPIELPVDERKLKVVVILVNWNGWQDTIECLESLQRLTYSAREVVLVDNGSTDDSVNKIRAWARGELPVASPRLTHSPVAKPVAWVELDLAAVETGVFRGIGAAEARTSLQEALTVIRTGENLGFAGGMNVGIRYASERGADFVWLLNNDTVVAPDALTRLVDGIRDLDRVGIAGPVELDYSHPERVVGSIGVVRPWKGATGGIPKALHFDAQGCATVELISGFSMLVNVAAIHTVGMMDERFFLYAEETEWCVRMRRDGWKVVYVPASKVWHKGSQSTGWGSPLMYYYVTRNQLRLFAMHFPYAVPFALARSVLRMVKLLRHGRWPQCKAAGRGLLDWARGRLGRLPAGPEDAETHLEVPKSAGGRAG